MLRRLLETRLRGAQRVARDMADDVDDRATLFLLEFAQERRRLAQLALFAFAAVLVTILATVWGAATLVAFAWDTPWRHHALIGLLVFWALLALFLGLRARDLLQSGDQAFALSRRVAADDVAYLREILRR